MAPRPTMDAWRRRFVRNVLATTVALQLPFALALGASVSRAFPLRILVALLALIAGTAFPAWRVFHWRDDRRAPSWRVWAIDTPAYVHFAACAMHGPLALLCALPLWLAKVPLAEGTLALYAVSAMVGAYAVLVRRFWTPVRRIEIEVDGLDPSLDGVRFAQLSDLHCGPYMPRWFYRSLARRAAALGADAIVLTGDLITDGEGYLDDVRDLAASCSAGARTYACLGNHDYFGTTEGVAEALKRGGAVLLRNEGEHWKPRKESTNLYLAGVDDYWTKRHDVDRAMAGRHEGESCVMLAHDPALFPSLAKRDDIDVVLSGHTHAGQVAIPFNVRRYNVAATRYQRTFGLYVIGRCTMYVHPGNGTSGPPLRLGAAPEIALITLRTKRASA